MDEIYRLKTETPNPIPNANIYDVGYAGMDPYQRDIYEKWLSGAKGLPQASIQAEAAKYRLRGLQRGSQVQQGV